MAITGNDLLEKSKKNRKKENEAITGEDLINRLKTYQSTDTSSVDQKYIDSFRSDSNSFLTTAEEDYGGVGWANASSSYESKNSTWQDLSARADAIGAWLYKNRNSLNSDEYKTLSDELYGFRSSGSAIMDKFKGAVDHYSQWETEDEYNKWYEEEQKKQAVLGAEDFDEYSSQGAAREAKFDWRGKVASGDNLIAAYRGDYGNKVSANNFLRNAHTAKSADIGLAQAMDDEEVGIYNYYLAKYGVDKANEYFDGLKETLNARIAGEVYKDIEDSTSLKLLAGVATGLDSFASGVHNLFADENEITTTQGQYLSSMIREDLSGGALVGYDLISNTANMLPSILVGTFTGGVGGVATMGASAAGNARAEMLKLGYSNDQAWAYGALVGGSEALLSYFLGGISKLGGKVSGNAVAKLVSKLDNAFARTAIQLGGKMASEGLEESIQTVLEPAFKALVTGEDFQSAEWDEILYSGLLGALSAGVLEGVPTIGGNIASTIKSNANAKDLYGNGSELVTEALYINADNKYAQKLKDKKSLSGGQINRLVEMNEQALVEGDTAKMKSAVEARLKALGETEDISELADVIVKARSGEKLTSAERAVLTESQYGRRVSTEMNPEMMATGEYSSAWAENIGTERINYDAYNKELLALANETAGVNVAEEKPAVAKASAETPTKAPTEKETATETSFKVSEDGKARLGDTEVSIKEIASIKNGEVMLRLDDGSKDGSTVKASEVSFSSNEEGLLYENVVDMGLNAVTANTFVKGFDGSMSVGDYVQGFKNAYRYGELGISKKELSSDEFASRLTDSVKNLAYNHGSINAKYKATEQEKVNKSKPKVSAEKKSANRTKYEKKGEIHNTAIKKSEVYKSLSDVQKAGVDGMIALYEGLGIDVYFFVSPTDAKGQRLGKNGYFVPEDGSVHIDLYAGLDGRGTILFTGGHELSHYIREKLPAQFKAFADIVFDKLEQKGVNVAELIAKKKADLKEMGRITPEMSEQEADDLAYEETVADACESMLADGKAFAEIAKKVKAKNKSLWEAIKQFFTNLVAKIKKAYEGLNPDSVVGNRVKEMLETAEELRSMWVDMLVEASEVGDTSDVSTDVVSVKDTTKYSYRSLAEAAGFEAVEDENGNRHFFRNGEAVSEVTVEDIENSPIGAFINYSLDKKDITAKQAKEQKEMFAKICTMACQTNDFAMAMQFVGSAVFTGMKANADKQYGTTYDFPSICTKTQAVIDAMSARMVKLGRGLSTEEITGIYRDVFASGNPVPCPECYVFSRWIGIGGLLDNIKKYQDYYGDMAPADVRKAYKEMHSQVSAFAEEQKLTFGKAKGALTSKLTKEYNKLTDKIEKKQNQGEKVDEADRKRLAEIEPLMNTVKAMTWIENVYFADSALTKVNPKFRVPNEVLFDLNKGEAFASVYKAAWAFRTTQGAGYGKAITPYAEARLGEGVLVTNNTTNAIKGKAQGTLKNYFLQQKGQMDATSRKALDNARAKQKNQAFIGGQRFQSTSDARYENASDYLLAALEMQAMHGMVQVYTKVDGAVAAFETWGFSTNQSLMPKGGGLDADGNVQDTSVGGMHPRVATENRNKHEHAGTITIGVNDNHIRALYRLINRDFVIPYHASGGKADVVAEFRTIQEGMEKKGEMVRSTDYSRTQGDKVLSDEVLAWLGKSEAEIEQIHKVREARIGILTRGKVDMAVVRGNRFLSALYDKLHGGEWDGVKLAKGKVASQIFPNEFWDQSVSYEESGKITRDYLEYCDDLGFLHRFSGLVPSNGMLVSVKGYDENGERVTLTDLAYQYDENGQKTDVVEDFYWKNITDRRMYGNNGQYLPQKYVTLVDTTTDTVTSFAKNNYGRQYDKALSMETAEKVKDKKYSDRVKASDRVTDKDSNGNELSKGQQDFFKESKIRNHNGDLLVAYHGTDAEFFVFDKAKIERGSFGKGFYFAEDRRMAQDYGNNIGEYYLNIKNPFIYDTVDKGYIVDMLDRSGYEYDKDFVDSFDEERLWDADLIDDFLHDALLGKDPYKELSQMLQNAGFDGIWAGGEIIAFEPEQIKRTDNLNPTSNPDIRYSDRILMGSLFSGGGTLEAGLAYQMLDKEFGVEYDGKIASVYADNHGDHIQVGKVEDFDISKYDDIFYLHASPVCHNFSKAKHGAKELQMDIDSAKATAKHLETAMPQVFTVENAPGYRKSQSLKIISDKLTELGYKWDVDVYNSADYGSATSRNRVILRAVKDAELPAKPTKQERTNSWDKVTKDLWETLPKSYLRPSFISAIENTPKLPILDADGNVNVNKPLLIITTTSGHTVTYCWEGEICPTLTTKCGEAKLVMPDGNIYAVTPEFMGRIQGLPDDYKYPKAKTRAFTIIGNGIPTHLTKAVVGGVLDSAYEQTHDGKVLYSDRNNDTAERAKEYFGTTDDPSKAGYMLADGTMLNFQNEGNRLGWDQEVFEEFGAHIDHHVICEVYGNKYDDNPLEAINKFISEGNVRLVIGALAGSADVVEISDTKAPSKVQLDKIYELAEQAFAQGKKFGVSYAPENWDESGPYEQFSAELSPSRVISNIKYYYANGTVRGGSGVYRYSDRSTDSFSNRTLLANALESVAQNDIERNKLAEYKSKIALIESEQAKLAEIRAKIKELSFAKRENRDDEAKRKLQFEEKQTANRINTYDKQLLNLESTKALKGVLEREKQMAYKRAEQRGKEALKAQREKDRERNAKTQRELLTRYQESRKKGIEGRHKTEMRYKIKKVVNELNQYLKGTKEKHVPIQLQRPVAEALRVVNMDTVGAEQRIAHKRELMRIAAAKGNMDKVTQLAKEIDHIQEMGENLKAKLSTLQTAYDSILQSDDPLVANAHDDVISNTIAKVIEVVGDTPVRDMSLGQLEAVYDMYKMVLANIRKANKTHASEKSEEISTIANGVIAELKEKKRKSPKSTKAGRVLSAFDWNNLKPVYAFERIGSMNLDKVFNRVLDAEGVWATDMEEAKAYRDEQKEKYDFKSFDFEKKYEFTSTSGEKFELNLGEIMSLYAWAKDEDAKTHLFGDGFQFDPHKEVVEKIKGVVKVTYNFDKATSYKLSQEILDEIIGVLDEVKGAKEFADAMQDYLANTMGEKGNEVSLKLYEIKLFKNKVYWPLKVSHEYLAVAKEKAEGKARVKNKGFTNERKKNAKNTVILSSFMDVWSDHVQEMSMYHAFTLPLEDFRRVIGYNTPSVSEETSAVSVRGELIEAHGRAAAQYIDQLFDDINGGAKGDPRETLAKSLVSRFKKASVVASLSVTAQQPTAIVRAMALVNPKHFVGKRVNKGKISEKWETMKKYAPVCIIKEMGSFDTGMSKGAVDWLKGEQTFMDKVDDALGKAPEFADKITWIAIWNAVERETFHKNKNLAPNSEEFLKAVGERFTEVIRKTQVYDSTLSKSANMRSKGLFMTMLTSFMAEPTTSINMLTDAFRKMKSNPKYFARALGAVYGSVVLNAAIVSLIYAMRDDDEDETFAEKYASRVVTEIVDGINPITYIPGVKDIWSVAQGFDVERADMTLVTNVFDSLQQVIRVTGKDTSNMDEEELAEHYKSVAEAWMSVGDGISSIFGLPVKNIRRDVKGVFNLFETLGRDQETTAGSLADKIGDDLKDSIPIWGWLPKESKGDKLYDAIVDGDKDYAERMKEYAEMEHFYTALREEGPIMAQAVKEVIISAKVDDGKTLAEAEESFVNGVKSSVKSHYEKGDLSYNEAMDMLTDFCGLSKDEAEVKIQYWEYKQDNPDADVVESWFEKYNEDVSSSGISIDMYIDYRTKIKGIEGDKDNNGNTISGSRKAKVMAVINSLPISNAQKDALYFAEGWTASKLWEAPWH